MRYSKPFKRVDRLLIGVKIVGIERLVKKAEKEAAMAERAASEDGPSSSSSRREPRTFNLPCAICCDRATGYHYEVPSCNGCKTFFRRTVLSRKTYRCISGDGKCLADRKTTDHSLRKKIRCRHCRYEKCLNQGMAPLSVTTSSLLEPETIELRRILKLEQECANFKPEAVSWTDAETLRRLSGPILEKNQIGPDYRLPPDHQGAMSKDLLKAYRFAADFEDFHQIATELQDDIVRSIVFPLTVVKEALDLVDSEEEALAHFGQHLAKLVSPFLREAIEQNEFVLMKVFLLLNSIACAGSPRGEQTQNRHLKLLMRYFHEKNGPCAPGRIITVMCAFHFLIAHAGSTSASPSSSRSGSQTSSACQHVPMEVDEAQQSQSCP